MSIFVAGCSSLSCDGSACIDRHYVCDGCTTGYQKTPDGTSCGSK